MKTRKSIYDAKVADVMTRRVETLTPADSIKDAASLMLDCKLTTVPVVDGQGHCIGILSRSDLTEMFIREDNELSNALDTGRLSLEWLNRSLNTGDTRQVRELMTYDVATVQAGQTIVEACHEMTTHQIHHLPVVDERNAVVGIISTFDVVASVAGN